MTLSQAYSKLNSEVGDELSEVQKKFQKLAMEHHPDRRGGSMEKMKEINNAMNIVKNPSLAEGEAEQSSSFFYPGENSYSSKPSSGSWKQDSRTQDFFQDFFGGGQRHREREQEATTKIIISSTEMKESGFVKSFLIKTSCVKVRPCPSCGGKGKRVVSNMKSIFSGQTSYTVVPCSSCNGSGSRKGTCPICQRNRSHEASWTLSLQMKQILNYLGVPIRVSIKAGRETKEKVVLFELKENPYSFFIKISSRGIEERLSRDDKISFMYLGVKETYNISALLNGSAVKKGKNYIVYFRLDIVSHSIK